ncbi:MAG: hypothetical protein QM817_05070 [Archangium sp.]
MKIGVICEGENSDGPALECLLQAEFQDHTFVVLGTTKAAIFSAAGALIDDMLSDGCQRVVVVWDLHPVGTQMTINAQTEADEACQMDQRRTLLAKALGTADKCADDIRELQHRYDFVPSEAALAPSRVALVCFAHSFDAVFLCDTELLRTLASSEIRTAEQMGTVKRPHTVQKPQEVIRRYFGKGHNAILKHFNKFQHNIVLAKAFVEKRRLARLRKHEAYGRLAGVIEVWVEPADA